MVSSRELCKYLPQANAVQWADVGALLLHWFVNEHVTVSISRISQDLTRLHLLRSNEYSSFLFLTPHSLHHVDSGPV